MKTLPILAMLVSLATLSQAQSPAPAGTLPMEPAGIAYRYFPRQFVQWVGPELPYSMIELDVDDRGPKPLYEAVLTDRATNKRVHYTNQPLEVAIDKAAGAEVYLVPMQFDEPAEAANGASYLLRFLTEKNTPVSWQFVQGSDITEQGAGMNPIAAPTPILLYREQAAVAGEGTALKVGAVTSVADMWKEISHPPYFVAYHGALSQDVHTLAFVPQSIAWKLDPAAPALAPGAEWTLSSVDGRKLSVHLDSFANGVATLHELHPAIGTSVTVEARQTPSGWALQRLVYGPTTAGKPGKNEHTITLNFTPGDAGAMNFDVVVGRKKNLADGELTTTTAGGESWTLTQPEWAHRPPVLADQTQGAQPVAQQASQAAAPAVTSVH